MRKPPAELTRFLSAYDPSIRKLFLSARSAVLSAAPDANELIYDAYNAVTVAYSFSDRLKEAFCHVAAYTGHVNLGFNRGAELTDETELLVGSGARIRHVRVSSASVLRDPALKALVLAAVEQGRGAANEPSKPRSQVRPTTGGKRRPQARRS